MKKPLKEKQYTRSESDKQIEALKEQLSVFQNKLDEKERIINELMITDNLTKLYNREYLATVLEKEIARCQRYAHPLAVIMIDIDGLRNFNADHGTMAGDKMLSLTGNIIKENIRKFDRPFRYGGEEFVVVLPETDMTMAYIVAERIRKNFESVCKKEFAPGQNGSYTVSTGITSVFAYTTNTIEIEELIDQADNALARAKRKGGNISSRFEYVFPLS
ncbi:MAG TPA: GGDEF domain-containing protein [Nitrospirae bacterium]|nr:diguanylate cyclase DosC [bacterium BMS3Abin09]GBE41525.1 diguanylate cyclase DosC [bacterium BMS3Bbin09]HDH34836.1 GGDEF domain-containing protein [Nitrospirota bacterium]HDO67243.1 GGDEF domain-containing protein [Nitrospirota bacterium]HDZ84236.1 GGDEF domain-containing protein [Nitrospirota bacterium]